MKKLIVLIILVGIFCVVVGCEMTPQDRMALSEAFMNWPQVEQQQRESGQIQVLPPIGGGRLVPQHNSTYWQEKNAKKEYYK